MDGLFITATVVALPEAFATWYVARSGQATAAATSVIGDHVVTMTLAFIPLTMAGLPIGDLRPFRVALAFVAPMPALHAAFIHFGGRRERGFRRWQVWTFPAVYAPCAAPMLVRVLPAGSSG